MDREMRRTSAPELRAEEDGDRPVIRGYAVVYDQMSVPIADFREIIEPGAFAGSLGQDVRALWQHEPSQVLGRTAAGTLRLFEDDHGVGFELWPAETQAGRDALTSIRRGDVDQMSFGFSVAKDGHDWEALEDGTPLRRIRAANLHEISPVTWAAYPQTSVSVRFDEIYGVIPEIPADLRAQDADDSDDGDVLRAQAARRERLLRMIR